MSIGIGIVGCGMIANFHALAIKDAKGAHLVGATSRAPEEYEPFVEKYGVRGYPTLAKTPVSD